MSKDLNLFIGSCKDNYPLLNQIGKQLGLTEDQINDLQHSKRSLLLTLSKNAKPKT